MKTSLYKVFYEKLPHKMESLLPLTDSKLVTFLNPYYLECLADRAQLYEKFDYIGSDAMLPVILNQLFKRKKTVRISFDMTSLAKVLFSWLETTGKGVYFVGSKQEYLERFVQVIQEHFPHLQIKGWHHGYIKGNFEEVRCLISDSKADVVVIGMGAPLQDEFAVYLRERGFLGSVYTCGGFIHQTVNKINYYPYWIDRFNLRFLYRVVKEPYVLKRLICYYPRFILKYSWFLWRKV